MKKVFLLLLLLRGFSFVAQNPNGLDTAWECSYGGPSVDEGRDLKETSDHGFIIAGTTGSFGDGNSSFYIIKTDSLGVHQWSRSFGTSNNDVARSVDLAGDGGYFFSGYSNGNAQTSYDGYLAKTDNLGNVLWTKTYGGSDWDFIYNACTMPDGGLIMCGESYSGSYGGSDAYLVRTTASGDTLWTKKIGVNGGDDAFYSIEQKNNRIYAVGKKFNMLTNKSNASIYKLDFNGQIIQQNFYEPDTMQNTAYNDLFITHDGQMLLGGKRIVTADTSERYILRKVDTTAFAEQQYATSGQNFDIKCVIEGYYNDVYTVSRGTDGFGGYSAEFFRFSPAFGFIYSHAFGGVKDEEPFEMIMTEKGYAFVGTTTSYGNSNGSVDKNVYLVVFNKLGLVHDYYLLITAYQDVLSPVGIKESKADVSATRVYPNPLKAGAAIYLGTEKLSGEALNYQLFDEQGRLADKETLTVIQDHISIDRKNIKAGVYYYRLKLNTTFISAGKLLIE